MSKIFVDQIEEKTSGNKITLNNTLKVDTIEPKTSGSIINLNYTRPAFSVRITTTSATNSTNVFGNTRQVYFNQGNHFQESGSNVGKFVAPVAGLYFFRVEGFSSDASNQNSSSTTVTLHLTKNGDTANDIVGRMAYSYQRYQDHQPITLVELLVLNANDAIGVRINQGYLYSSNSTISPYFSGCFLG